MKKITLVLSTSFVFMLTSLFATPYNKGGRYSSVPSLNRTLVTSDIAPFGSSSVLGSESLTDVEASESEAEGESATSEPDTSIGLRSTKGSAATPTLPGINTINEVATTARLLAKLAEGLGYSSLSFMQQGAKGKYYDPMTPSKVVYYTTSLTYEYTPNKFISFGITPSFSHTKTQYLLIPQSENNDTYSLSPFVSYFLSSEWLLMAQGSLGYDQSTLTTSITNSSLTNLDKHTLQYSMAGYITWLAPEGVLSGTLSFGATYSSDYTRSAFDNTGALVSSAKSQRGGPSLSGALNYTLNESWILSFQASLDYSFKITPLSASYKPSGGRQRLRVSAGSSLSYDFGEGISCSLGYTRTEGYGYYRENMLALQARILV